MCVWCKTLFFFFFFFFFSIIFSLSLCLFVNIGGGGEGWDREWKLLRPSVLCCCCCSSGVNDERQYCVVSCCSTPSSSFFVPLTPFELKNRFAASGARASFSTRFHLCKRITHSHHSRLPSPWFNMCARLFLLSICVLFSCLFSSCLLLSFCDVVVISFFFPLQTFSSPFSRSDKHKLIADDL